MFGETTISQVKVWNHPIETTIYKWLAFGFQDACRIAKWDVNMRKNQNLPPKNQQVGPYQLQMELWGPYKWPYKWVAGVITPINL